MTFDHYARQRIHPLLRTATAITGDPHLAEEIVQDVLIKIDRHWSKISALPNRDAYVRRMVVNEYLSWRRKWARQIPHDALDAGTVEDPATRIATRDLLRTQLATLPRKQQVALALRYFEGLSDQEIADTIGITASSVRSTISRALARLRTTIDDSHLTPGGTR